jgi:hypothetical protein
LKTRKKFVTVILPSLTVRVSPLPQIVMPPVMQKFRSTSLTETSRAACKSMLLESAARPLVKVRRSVGTTWLWRVNVVASPRARELRLPLPYRLLDQALFHPTDRLVDQAVFLPLDRLLDQAVFLPLYRPLDRPVLLPPCRPLDRPVLRVLCRLLDHRRLRVVATPVRTVSSLSLQV